MFQLQERFPKWHQLLVKTDLNINMLMKFEQNKNKHWKYTNIEILYKKLVIYFGKALSPILEDVSVTETIACC